MYKLGLLLSFCCVGVLSLVAQNAPTATLMGRFYGMNGTKRWIYLYAMEGKRLNTVDSTQPDGEGSFRFQKAYPEGLYKVGFSMQMSNEVVVAGGETVNLFANLGDVGKPGGLTANSTQNEMYRTLESAIDRFSRAADSVNNKSRYVLTTEPKYNQIAEERNNTLRNLTIRLINQPIAALQQKAPNSYVAQVLCNLYRFPVREGALAQQFDNDLAFFHQHWFDYVPWGDPRVLRSGHLSDKILLFFEAYVDRRVDIGFKNGIQRIYDLSGAHPDVRKFAINYLVEVFDEKGPNGLADYVINNFLSSCGGPTPAVRNIIARLSRLKVGQKVPDITLNNPQGQPTSLYNNLGSPVTLLLFWGSWCNHCKEENPKILEFTRRYRDRGLSVFAVGVENDLSEWRPAVAALGSHWTHVAETNLFNGNTARNFDVKTTPTLFLLDAQGKVLAAHFQPELLENYLGQLFK